MLEDRPSLTAMAVCALRGVASLPGHIPALVHDPFAAALLPTPVGALLKGAEQVSHTAPWLREALHTLTAPLGTHIALRTAAIDAAVLDAHALGIRQLVLVGAGLDARAWRMEALEAWNVWEVDHPATQRWKLARVPERPVGAPAVHFAAADFERESLHAPLDRTQHDATRRSVWIWEGVTMYLDPAAADATLRVMTERSPAGSRLLLTYVCPDFANLHPALSPIVLPLFQGLGEPLKATWTPDAMRSLLEGAGWDVVTDEGTRQWCTRFDQPVPTLRVQERLVVAERR